MARQPLLPTYKDAPLEIGSSLIEQLPKLAELVGRIAINWSGVEVQLSAALGSLLGVENAAAVAVFTSLRNHRAQRDALRAAASQTLDGDIADVFDSILAVHEELDKQRNDVIHGIWGRCVATPDGIIWSSLQTHANMLITDYHMEKAGTLTPEARVHNISNGLFVVRFKDLEELNQSIKALDRAIGNFHAYLRYESKSPGKHAWRQLFEDPLLQAAKEKRVASRKKKSVGEDG